MKILSVAYPLLPVGADSGGGAEQILYLLERGLVQRGHHSVVIAAENSRISGELVGTPSFRGEITEQVRSTAQGVHRQAINQVLTRFQPDLIHFHGLDFYEYLPSARIPRLGTLHLPPAWYPESVFSLPNISLNCVSESQANVAPGNARLPVVPNGVDVGLYRGCSGQRRHLLWIGRVCPEKGVHLALEVAHRLDLPIVVAGPVHPFREHEAYFSECVAPLLDEKRRYAGPVGLTEKKQLLAQAYCLLAPTLVAETSSLVAMEAISSGTPVVAYRSGALPEIVENGITGFVVDSQDEMANAIARVRDISPEICRERASLRFDAECMVESYLKLYDSL